MRIALVVFAGGCVAEPQPTKDDRSAEACGICHPDHLAEWQGSAHASSGRSPLLRLLVPEVERAWGGLAGRRCEGCHRPGHAGDAGIGCTSCHGAVGNHAERDGRLALDQEGPIAGPLGLRTEAHETRPADFLASESLCGTCHEVTGPGLLEEPTLTEFRASPAAAIGQGCVDCHLPRSAPRPLVDGGLRRPVRDHRFVGFDPPWDAPPDEAAAAAGRTRELLRAALALRARRLGDSVEIRVQNAGAAHRVPTGASFLRDLWVDVEVAGRLVAPRLLQLGDQPTRSGRPVVLLTDADAVTRGGLRPGDEVVVLLEEAPSTALTVVLRGRAVRDEVLEALGAPELSAQVPTHEIARVELAR